MATTYTTKPASSLPGEVYETTVGDKYQSGRKVADVAKLVRADLKAAMKAGELPPHKASVRTERYSGGCELFVIIQAIEADVIHFEGWQYMEEHPHDSWMDAGGELSPNGSDIIRNFKAIIESYQRKVVQRETDYYQSNFSLSVRFDRDLLRAQYEAAKLARSQPQPADTITDALANAFGFEAEPEAEPVEVAQPEAVQADSLGDVLADAFSVEAEAAKPIVPPAEPQPAAEIPADPLDLANLLGCSIIVSMM